MVTKSRAWLAAIGSSFVAFLVLVLGLADPAGAELDGPCTGRGTFASDREVVDAATTEKVVVAPEDTVSYEGTITATEGEERSHRGRIDLELPPPLPPVEIADWGSDSTTEVSDAGTYDYDLPSFVPRGVELELTGEHDDTAGTCTGSVTVEIDGGPFDAPVAPIISIIGTLAAAGGVAVAARPRGLG